MFDIPVSKQVKIVSAEVFRYSDYYYIFYKWRLHVVNIYEWMKYNMKVPVNYCFSKKGMLRWEHEICEVNPNEVFFCFANSVHDFGTWQKLLLAEYFT